MDELMKVTCLYLAAFFYFRGFPPKLQRDPSPTAPSSKNVSFFFHKSVELSKALEEYNEGVLVDAQEYARAIKRLRAAMIQAKQAA